MPPKPLRYRDPANVPAHLVALMPKPRKKTKKNDTDTITDEEREHDLLAQPGMNITTEEIQ